jgi:hypothetical protein
MTHIKKFNEFVDSDVVFGEFRKGSSKYGQLINDIMLFLRNYDIDNNDNLTFNVKDINIDLDMLNKLKNDDNKNKLISFDIEYLDNNKNIVDNIDKNGYIRFINLNKKMNDRPWENKINE